MKKKDIERKNENKAKYNEVIKKLVSENKIQCVIV